MPTYRLEDDAATMISPLSSAVDQLAQEHAYLRVQADNLENRLLLSERRAARLEESSKRFSSLNTKHAGLHHSVRNMDEELQRQGKSLAEGRDDLQKHIHYLWLSLGVTWITGGLLLVVSILR